jgi:hypothetical protein
MRLLHPLLIAATLFGDARDAVAQQVDWVKQIGGTSSDLVRGMTLDDIGGIYITGSLGAGGTPPGSYVDGEWFPVSGTRDIYIARFSPVGEMDWVVVAGGPGPPGADEAEFGINVVFDTIAAHLFVQGSYDSQLTNFGKNNTLTGQGHFLARYSDTGECAWVRGVPWGRGSSLAVDRFGAVYALGFRFAWTDNNFLVKYDAEGDQLWLKDFGSGTNGSLAMDQDTLVMATTMEHGDELSGISFTTVSEGDIVILRMDTAASILSFQQYGSDSLAWVTDLKVAPDGTLLIAGSFFNSLQLPTDTLYSSHGHEVRFLIKADREGVPIWAKTFEVQDYDGPLGWPKVSLGPDSNIHLLLDLRGNMVVEPDTLVPNTNNDLLILRYSWDGDLEGMYHEGTISLPRMIASTSDGAIIFGGTFHQPLNIGEGLVSNGGLDAFIARMSTISTSAEYKSSQSGSLLIYANPNDGTCTIELPQELRWTQGLMLYIHDAQGRLVQSIPLRQEEGRVALDIRAQAKGMYPVHVTDGRQRYSGTIVFE